MRHKISSILRHAIPALPLLLLIFIPAVQNASDEHQELFQTSDRCFACHNSLTTASGEDISIGFAWRSTMMANSSRDPYWQAGVRRETMDHPESQKEIEDECSKCHMPMARYQSKYEGRAGEVFSHLDFNSDERIDLMAQDGVSCSLCHQITSDKLGTRDSLVGGFVIDTQKPKGERAEYGPYKVNDGLLRIMRSSSGGYKPTEGEHVRKSELCATCHTLITTALGPEGKVIGNLPEQMPYQEWYNSSYRETQSCQSCHMPVVKEKVRIANTLGEMREDMGRHVFVGGNFFVLNILNEHRSDLGVEALPQEMAATVNRTVDHLKSQTAEVSIDRVDTSAGRLQTDISVRNLSGHKFPTAYPSRRSWLHVVVTDRTGRVVFESGKLNSNGSIQGNDNDDDATKFEPHYLEINNAGQVQIYEDIMVGANNVPTTGLLTAVRFIKDNRLLPKGFDKRAAAAEIAPQGEAVSDADFSEGGDRIRYSIPVTDGAGPFKVDAELLFQPIAFRWAANLKNYKAPETERFTGYYDAMSGSSAVVISKASK